MENTIREIFQRLTALEVKMTVVIALNSAVLIAFLKPLGKKIADKIWNNGKGKK